MAMILFTTIVVETAIIAPHDSIISIIMVIFIVKMIINHVQHNTYMYKLYSDILHNYMYVSLIFSTENCCHTQENHFSASTWLSLKTQLKNKGHFCPFYYKISTKIPVSRLLFELQPLQLF